MTSRYVYHYILTGTTSLDTKVTADGVGTTGIRIDNGNEYQLFKNQIIDINKLPKATYTMQLSFLHEITQ